MIACKASKLTLVCVDQPICQSRIYFGDKFKEKWIGGGALRAGSLGRLYLTRKCAGTVSERIC